MSFINSPRFPVDISLNSRGGPTFKTSVVKIASGHESRNQQWVNSRRSYNASFGVRSYPQLQDLVSFFHEARGMLHTFRYKDFLDFSVAAEVVDATEGPFQLTKTYGSANPYIRNITKLVTATVTIFNNGSPLVESTNYTLDYTTGLVTKISGFTGVITWTGEFDVPVRFDQDQIDVALSSHVTGGTSTMLIEVKE